MSTTSSSSSSTMSGEFVAIFRRKRWNIPKRGQQTSQTYLPPRPQDFLLLLLLRGSHGFTMSSSTVERERAFKLLFSSSPSAFIYFLCFFNLWASGISNGCVCVCALLLFLFFQCPTGWTDWKTGHQPHRQKRWRKRRRNSQTPILLYTGVNKSAVNRRRRWRRLTQRKEFPFYWEVVEDGRAGATHSIFGWYLLQIRAFLPRRRRDRLHFVAVVRTNCACHVCLFSSYDIPNDRLWLDRSWRCQTEGKKKRRTAREFRSVSPLL